MTAESEPLALPAGTEAPQPAELDAELDPELIARIRAAPRCSHCGGVHVRACPRVRSMSWHPNGTIASVEFWPDGRWSDAHIIWPEQVADDPNPQ